MAYSNQYPLAVHPKNSSVTTAGKAKSLPTGRTVATSRNARIAGTSKK